MFFFHDSSPLPSTSTTPHSTITHQARQTSTNEVVAVSQTAMIPDALFIAIGIWVVVAGLEGTMFYLYAIYGWSYPFSTTVMIFVMSLLVSDCLRQDTREKRREHERLEGKKRVQ